MASTMSPISASPASIAISPKPRISRNSPRRSPRRQSRGERPAILTRFPERRRGTISSEARNARPMTFWTYLLHCADRSYYTGHTDDLDKRVYQHNEGILGGYTSTRRPVELVWAEGFETREEAKTAELKIKNWSRAKKEALIAKDWGRLKRDRKSVV